MLKVTLEDIADADPVLYRSLSYVRDMETVEIEHSLICTKVQQKTPFLHT